jgi:predicted transposase/invertase (TIGR01784 family)
MENKEVKKAKEVLEEISQNEHERYRAELRQKYIMDQKAVEEAGFDKGLTAGIKQNQIKIAKKLLKKGTKLEEIIELTDLTKDEIISIKDK